MHGAKHEDCSGIFENFGPIFMGHCNFKVQGHVIHNHEIKLHFSLLLQNTALSLIYAEPSGRAV